MNRSAPSGATIFTHSGVVSTIARNCALASISAFLDVGGRWRTGRSQQLLAEAGSLRVARNDKAPACGRLTAARLYPSAAACAAAEASVGHFPPTTFPAGNPPQIQGEKVRCANRSLHRTGVPQHTNRLAHGLRPGTAARTLRLRAAAHSSPPGRDGASCADFCEASRDCSTWDGVHHEVRRVVVGRPTRQGGRRQDR